VIKVARKDTALDPVLEMELRLPDLWKYSEKMKSKMWKLMQGSSEHRVLGRAKRAIWTETWALQDHIITVTCMLMAGATVYAVLTSTLNDPCENNTGHKRIYSRSNHALSSAVPVLSDVARLYMKDRSTEQCATDYTDLLPGVAISVD
jgi:hypothetical protein